MAYTKLDTTLVLSTVWRAPDHVRLVWITMLSLVDRDGEVRASVPGLADVARVTLEHCEAAIAHLSAPDPHSRSKREEGRRITPIDGGWHLVNFDEHRNRLGAEERRAKAAARQQRYAARLASSVSSVSKRQQASVLTSDDGNDYTHRAAPAPAPAAAADPDLTQVKLRTSHHTDSRAEARAGNGAPTISTITPSPSHDDARSDAIEPDHVPEHVPEADRATQRVLDPARIATASLGDVDVTALPTSRVSAKRHTRAKLAPSTSSTALGHVELVFATWRTRSGKRTAKLDAKRRARIEWALAHYELADVLASICGYCADPWHRGENDRHKPFLELSMILRDAEHVERGIELGVGAPQTTLDRKTQHTAWTRAMRELERQARIARGTGKVEEAYELERRRAAMERDGPVRFGSAPRSGPVRSADAERTASVGRDALSNALRGAFGESERSG